MVMAGHNALLRIYKIGTHDKKRGSIQGSVQVIQVIPKPGGY